MKTSSEVWYLLYGGTSSDGAGGGSYVGRTTSKEEAIEHWTNCRRDPYSVGGVSVLTDKESWIIWQEKDFDRF